MKATLSNLFKAAAAIVTFGTVDEVNHAINVTSTYAKGMAANKKKNDLQK